MKRLKIWIVSAACLFTAAISFTANARAAAAEFDRLNFCYSSIAEGRFIKELYPR